MWRRLDHQESVRPRGSSAVAVVLRLTLKLANTLLALLGLAVMVYAVYMYGEVHRRPAALPPPSPPPSPPMTPPPEPSPVPPPPQAPPPAAVLAAFALAAQHAAMPWFIYAFFGAGLFTFITAATGLVGAARNSRVCLGLYAFLAIVLLMAQGALALAFFADSHWQKKLPHDETGEARRLRRWIEHNMDICKWVGLALLLLQVLSVAVAFALSSVQARALEGDTDEEDEVWGRRQPLLAGNVAAGSGGAGPSAISDVEAPPPTLPTPTKEDPWSQRMRDKYGLDTSQFTYSPPVQPGDAAGGSAATGQPAVPQGDQQHGGSRCSIM